MDSRPSPPASLFRRRRRLVCLVVFVITLLFIFGVPWELPYELQDSAVVPTGLSRANIVPLAKQPSHQAEGVDEIYGLLHFVTRDDQFLLSTSEALDPGKPIDLKVYSNGKEDWSKNVKKLNEEYPIIVFSKTYCSFSKKAKELLEYYDLAPRPKIIEVDLRDDSDLLKIILHRLTARSTFPNVFVLGQSIGGSDDLHALHSEGKLKGILERARVKVNGAGE